MACRREQCFDYRRMPIVLNVDRYRTKVISYLEENTGKNVEIGRQAVTFPPG